MRGASESQRAAAAELEGLLAELRAEPDAATAEAAALQTAVPVLDELTGSLWAVWSDRLLKQFPGLTEDVLARRKQARREEEVSSPPPPRWQPFPTAALPRQVARYVEEVAAAIGCDESMVALPTLACLAGVVGNRRRVRLKRGWTEPAIIWGAVVGRSGTRKSPALGEASRPLRDREALEIDEAERRAQQYERDLQAWQDLPKGERGERPPEPPPARRALVSDVTVEALAARLSESPAGLLLYRDELAGWVRSFDRYRSGRGGDAQAWLEMHRAGTIVVDRRSGPTLSVRRAAVSIVGGVQPEVLRGALSGEHLVDGLAARLLFVMPPERPKRWTDAVVSDAAQDRWAALLDGLRELPFAVDVVDDHRPVDLPFTGEARDLFRDWYEIHAHRQANAETDTMAAALAKLEAYAARLALIVELASDPLAEHVGLDAMRSGIRLAEWFVGEAERVYGAFHETEEDRERRKLVEWVQGKGGRVTERDLAHGPRRYRERGAATVALQALVAAGEGEWQDVEPGPKGGRPTREFVLYGGAGTETPFGASGTETGAETSTFNDGACSQAEKSAPKPGNGRGVSAPAPPVDSEKREISTGGGDRDLFDDDEEEDDGWQEVVT